MTNILKLIYLASCLVTCSKAFQDVLEEYQIGVDKMNDTSGEVKGELNNLDLDVFDLKIEPHVLNDTSDGEMSIANRTEPASRKKLSCSEIANNSVNPMAKVINGSELISILVPDKEAKKTTPSHCVVVMFYMRSCPFSRTAAPWFNALARIYPDVSFLAVDAVENHSYNMMFGVISVPTIIFFHNGKPIERYNNTNITLSTFSAFIMRVTDIFPIATLDVTSADVYGPVPAIAPQERDIWLWLSWIFIVLCLLYCVSKTTTWKKIVDNIYATWCEAGAEHEHID